MIDAPAGPAGFDVRLPAPAIDQDDPDDADDPLPHAREERVRSTLSATMKCMCPSSCRPPRRRRSGALPTRTDDRNGLGALCATRSTQGDGPGLRRSPGPSGRLLCVRLLHPSGGGGGGELAGGAGGASGASGWASGDRGRDVGGRRRRVGGLRCFGRDGRGSQAWRPGSQAWRPESQARRPESQARRLCPASPEQPERPRRASPEQPERPRRA